MCTSGSTGRVDEGTQKRSRLIVAVDIVSTEVGDEYVGTDLEDVEWACSSRGKAAEICSVEGIAVDGVYSSAIATPVVGDPDFVANFIESAHVVERGRDRAEVLTVEIEAEN